MGWLWWGLGLVVFLFLISIIWFRSDKGVQYHIGDAFEYATRNGNVPQSYSVLNWTYLFKNHFKDDIKLFPWMDALEFDLPKKLGFMLCFWYSRNLVDLGLISDYFIEIKKEEFDSKRKEAIIHVENIDSSNQIINDAILMLKYLGIHGDAQSADYLSKLFLKNNQKDTDIQFAFFWLAISHELIEQESTFLKARKIVEDHPEFDFEAEKIEGLLLQDLYLDVLKRNIYVEDWQSRFDKQEETKS